MVALLNGIPYTHVLGGFASWQNCASSRRVLYIFVKLMGVPLLDSQHVLPPLGLSAEGKEAHANTQSYPVLQRTFKPRLQDTTLPSVIAQQYGFTLSFLVKDHRKQKNNLLNSPT